MTDIITLPGIGGSGEAHWQTRWEALDRSMRRFQPSDWELPDLADWISALDRAVDISKSPPVLVAHSLACLLVAHWQSKSSRPVAGAFLVAVPDPRSPVFPRDAASFADPPQEALRFPSLVLASTDDPYGDVRYVKKQAGRWGSGYLEVGHHGHINGQSGLGKWSQGRNLLTAFLAGLPRC
jgi:serine hydrolase